MICFTPSHSTGHSGWLGGQSVGGVKLTLDLAIGETSAIESQDKGKIADIVQKVKDLNGRLQDIKREQVFQRVCVICILLIMKIKNTKDFLTNWDNHRNEKLNSVTSPKPRTPALSVVH